MKGIPQEYLAPQDQAEKDAAKRIRDGWNLHKLAGAQGLWIAHRLSDGAAFGETFDTKRDAVRAVPDERWYMFLRITPAGMSLVEATVLLRTHRRMADAGIRLADPDDKNGGRDIIPRLTQEDARNQASAMAGLRAPSNITFRR